VDCSGESIAESKSNPMTKSDEIQILSAAADSLGSDSYCGQWLREQIPFIESDIQSDIEPGILASASIQDCARKCFEMRGEAMRDRSKIIQDARDEAERIMENALKLADSIRSGLRRDIENALHQITKI
jgi:cell division septum initiation protein DivIVA